MGRRRTPLLLVLAVFLVALMAAPAAAGPSRDPKSGDQWGLIDIKAPDAWPRGRGAGVSVAVISTGIARHDDLVNKLDGGFDLSGGATNDPNVDDNGQGTRLAGIVGAETDNGIGIAGVAPDARLIPYKAYSSDAKGNGHIDALSQARGAKPAVALVDIPDSYSGNKDVLRQALKSLADSGVSVVVGAQGGLALDDLPVLAVAATTQSGGQVPGTAGVGPQGVAAPGQDILSTTVTPPSVLATGSSPTYGYGEASGTSQAAAHVAGGVAILRGVGANARQAADLLRSTARKSGTAGLGAGIIDVAAAAGAYKATPPPAPTTTAKPAPKAGTVARPGSPGVTSIAPGQVIPLTPSGGPTLSGEPVEPGAGQEAVAPPGADAFADSGDTGGPSIRVGGHERPWGALAVGFGLLFGLGSGLSLTFRRMADAPI